MRSTNYRHARKEKERSRKLRQNEKLQRRTARAKDAANPTPPDDKPAPG